MAALGGLSGRFWGALEPQDGAQEAPRRLPGGTPEAKMEPQRPSNEPQEASGVRESTGKQLGAPRRKGKRPASARSARARAPREAAYNIAESSANLGKQLQSISLTTAGTGKQLAPPASHRSDRNVACTTAKPPQGPENGLHHRLATGKPRTTARRTFARTAFSDSAFRFLSRQVLGLGGDTGGWETRT